jgi:anti-anti-sigma factor
MNRAPFDLICVETSDGTLEATITGELDLAVESHVIDSVTAAMTATDASMLVLDMSKVTFIDSSGLRALMTCRDSAERAGMAVALRVVPGPVTHLLDVAGVADWFAYDDGG